MKKKVLAIIITAVIAVTSNSSILSAHEDIEPTVQKDYTQAPYYYALEEWFDFNNYTSEQREDFMSDTETLDWMLYNDDYWNYGNYSFTSLEDADNGIETYAAPSYPITGYEGGTFFTEEALTDDPDKPGCESHSSCSIYGGCGCRSVNNSIQCLGFANFFRWARTGSYLNSTTQINGLSGNWSADNIKKYFLEKLNLGSHVRLHLRGQKEIYMHSITVVEMSSSGVKVYDCNWDKKCGIREKNLSWNDIYQNFDAITYSNRFAG